MITDLLLVLQVSQKLNNFKDPQQWGQGQINSDRQTCNPTIIPDIKCVGPIRKLQKQGQIKLPIWHEHLNIVDLLFKVSEKRT